MAYVEGFTRHRRFGVSEAVAGCFLAGTYHFNNSTNLRCDHAPCGCDTLIDIAIHISWDTSVHLLHTSLSQLQ
jgi:hypothetical protein